MSAAHHSFPPLLAAQRAGHTKRLRVAVFLCLVIAALLYQTTWIVLRPGLAILLAGQLAVAASLVFRIRQLNRTLITELSATREGQDRAAWFTSEERFLHRLATTEALSQQLGFACLGYEFWVATASVWLALFIGLFYPLALYFGITRRRNSTALRQLLAQKQGIAP